MKKLILLLLFYANVSFAQDLNIAKMSEQVLTDMRNREFGKITARFDSSVAARIDTSRLRKVWDNMLKLGGDFVKVNDTSSTYQPYFVVFIQHCQFEHRKIDFKLVFGPNGLIKGITFTSGEPRQHWSPPAYYNEDLVVERPLILENGPYRLPGMLTTPRKIGRFPVVVLIHGSGPNDRDETVGPTKIFKDIAYGLGTKGISVFRYDKRTRVYAAKMAQDKNMTVNDESVEDAIAAVRLLRSDSTVDTTAIFLCGHSMGGMLLPRIASQLKGIKGLIYLCPNGRPLEDLLYEQTLYILSLDTSGKDESRLLDSIKIESDKIKKLNTSDRDTTPIFHIQRSYWLDLNNYDPIKTAAGLNMPMMILQGERDYQVTMKDFNIWKAGLKGKNVEFRLYPDLNHFFITGEGKSTPSEYMQSGNVEEEVINDMYDWILSIGH